jgi:molecular chaperone GrpE
MMLQNENAKAPDETPSAAQDAPAAAGFPAPEVAGRPAEPSGAGTEAAAQAENVLQALREQVAKQETEKADLRNALIRLQADFENYRKRIARERQEDGAKHTAHVVESLLPVLDAFERAFADDPGQTTPAAGRGFELIYRQLLEALKRLGVERIEAQGRHFDPHLHHAVERAETADVPEGTIVEELRAGYRLRQRVLRPAMVRVAVAPAPAAANTGKSPSAADEAR